MRVVMGELTPCLHKNSYQKKRPHKLGENSSTSNDPNTVRRLDGSNIHTETNQLPTSHTSSAFEQIQDQVSFCSPHLACLNCEGNNFILHGTINILAQLIAQCSIEIPIQYASRHCPSSQLYMKLKQTNVSPSSSSVQALVHNHYVLL